MGGGLYLPPLLRQLLFSLPVSFFLRCFRGGGFRIRERRSRRPRAPSQLFISWSFAISSSLRRTQLLRRTVERFLYFANSLETPSRGLLLSQRPASCSGGSSYFASFFRQTLCCDFFSSLPSAKRKAQLSFFKLNSEGLHNVKDRDGVVEFLRSSAHFDMLGTCGELEFSTAFPLLMNWARYARRSELAALFSSAGGPRNICPSPAKSKRKMTYRCAFVAALRDHLGFLCATSLLWFLTALGGERFTRRAGLRTRRFPPRARG